MEEVAINLERPTFFHRFMIVLSASLLISHTFSTLGFFFTGSSFVLVGTYPFISVIGTIIGVLAIFILANVDSEKNSIFSSSVRGIVLFALVSIGQFLGIYMATRSLQFPPVAFFAAGMLLLPVYSLMTSAVSVIYLFDLPRRSVIIRRLLPSLFMQRVFVSVFALWVIYSTINAILIPSDTFSTNPINLLTPLLFVFGLKTLHEKLISTLGSTSGKRYFSLLSVVYIASLGMLTLLEMGTSNYDPTVHQVTMDLDMILGVLEYPNQMSTIFTFSLVASLMTIVGTIVPIYMNIGKNDVHFERSITFFRKIPKVAMIYLVLASFMIGLQSANEFVNIQSTDDGKDGYYRISINSYFEPVMMEILVCSETDLKEDIFIIEEDFGFDVPSDYDIIFQEMQTLDITDSPVILPSYGHCINIILENITYPSKVDSGSGLLLGISGSTKDDPIVAILHDKGDFIDIGSHNPATEQEQAIASIPILGLLLGFPIIAFFDWRKHRKTSS